MEQATFSISGAAMSTISGSDLYQNHSVYDPTNPEATARASAALRGAKSRKAGKGRTYLVTCDKGAAEVIRKYCDKVGSGFASETEPDIRAEGRALLVAAERIRMMTW